MQLRISPGGRTRFSRRKRPELPPSSVTVTTAVRSTMGRSELGRSSRRRRTCSLRPRRSVERPVPPPSATTRKPGIKRFDFVILSPIKRHIFRKVLGLKIRLYRKSRGHCIRGNGKTGGIANSYKNLGFDAGSLGGEPGRAAGLCLVQNTSRMLATESLFFRVQQFG